MLSSTLDINPIIVKKIGQLAKNEQENKLIIELLKHEIRWIHGSDDPRGQFAKEYQKIISRHFPFVDET